MALELNSSLVIGISSRSLFDLEYENEMFNREGIEVYQRYQLENENLVLKPGTAFPLVKALLNLNQHSSEERLVEVIVMSRNSPDTALRIFHSIKHYGLDIVRAAFSGGQPLSPYLNAFHVDLFLSKNYGDVQSAIDGGFAAALIYDPPTAPIMETEQIRIAFDADAVIFSDESERVYKEHGLKAFQDHENERAYAPLPEGPFARFLKGLSHLQSRLKVEPPPLRLAIVTARSSPAHERILRTLRHWGVSVDEAFFMGGVSKHKILEAFRPQIFFDDQETHLHSASRLVPAGKVPYRSDSPLNKGEKI